MKFKYSHLAAIAILLSVSGCAVEKESTANDDEKVFLEAWVQVHCPSAKKQGMGIYIIDDKPSENNMPVKKDGYAFVTYTVRDIEGSIVETTDSLKAQMIGQFNPSSYYGNKVWILRQGAIHRGVYDMLDGMTVGSTRTALIPRWLRTFRTFSSEEEYMNESDNSSSHVIYTVTVHEQTDDINKWQIDSLERFAAKYMEGTDSTMYGFYYKTLKKPVSDKKMPKDTTVYINYTGRLLNGQVFDTTIKDTAKRYNIYSSSKTYEPVSVKVGEELHEIKLNDSGVITGFAKTISMMKAMERGFGVFYSELGYKSSGSGSTIPGYAPLLFDVELVKKPE